MTAALVWRLAALSCAKFNFRHVSLWCIYGRRNIAAVCGAKLFCLLAETETETETRRNSDETLYLYHIFPECQRNVSKRQTHPFQYQDHEILEFRGTFTAFLSDVDRRSIIMYMLGLSTLANISQLSPCILLWSTTCTPWALPLLMEADILTKMHQ